MLNTERNNGPQIGDGVSDGLDFLVWQEQFGRSPTVLASGDFDEDTDVDAADRAIWENGYGINNDADGNPAGHVHNFPNKTVGIRLAAVAAPLTALTAGSDGDLTPSFGSTTVPEPSSLALGLIRYLLDGV